MSVQVPPNSTGSVIETATIVSGGLNVRNVGERQLVGIVDSGLPTYSAAYTAQSIGTSATTAIFFLAGSATKIVRLVQLVINVTIATAGVEMDFSLQKETVLPTGGTKATAATIIPWDTGDAAATATTGFYTATPTDGTSTGVFFVTKMSAYILTATTVQPPTIPYVFNFGLPGSKQPTLRGVAQGVVATINAATLANVTSWDVTMVWTETSGD